MKNQLFAIACKFRPIAKIFEFKCSETITNEEYPMHGVLAEKPRNFKTFST